MADSFSASIVTLCEGDYFLGLGALLNSLHKGGFQGDFWIGYKKALPPVCDIERWKVLLGPDIRLHFELFEGDKHYTHRKAEFMSYVLEKSAQQPGSLFYVDPDIVFKCRWQFIEGWVQRGVIGCEDVNSPVSRYHPWRASWRELCAEKNFQWSWDLDIYVNAGFVGVPRSAFGFLKDWQSCLDAVFEIVPPSTGLALDDPLSPYSSPDQDALNIALCTSRYPISLGGREFMDFQPGGRVMSHAIGAAKPWRRNFIYDALRGLPPTKADKGYLQNSQSPIRLYSPLRLAARKLSMLVGSSIGRFYRRTGI